MKVTQSNPICVQHAIMHAFGDVAAPPGSTSYVEYYNQHQPKKTAPQRLDIAPQLEQVTIKTVPELCGKDVSENSEMLPNFWKALKELPGAKGG